MCSYQTTYLMIHTAFRYSGIKNCNKLCDGQRQRQLSQHIYIYICMYLKLHKHNMQIQVRTLYSWNMYPNIFENIYNIFYSLIKALNLPALFNRALVWGQSKKDPWLMSNTYPISSGTAHTCASTRELIHTQFGLHNNL